VLPSLVFLSLASGSGGLQWLQEPRCPDREAIEQQLQRIAPQVLEGPARHFAKLEVNAEGLRAQLFDAEGHLLEERFVAGTKDCQQWAEIAAALLASWEADLAAPTLAPLELPQEVVRPAPFLRGELGLGATGTLATSGSLAPGAEVLLELESYRRGLGGDLLLNWVSRRSFAVGAGTANWQQFALALGGHGALGSHALRLELGAAFIAGLVDVYGDGFPASQGAWSFDPGIGLSTRGRWEFAHGWLAWLRFGASIWLAAERVQVLSGTTSTFTANLPQVDLSLSLGLSRMADL
jgi:hypothetical protein